jgi:hypothetical protein
MLNEMPLRKALLGGYRVADVQVLAAHWRNALERVSAEVEAAKERAVRLEVELRVTRTRREGYIAREAELNKALGNAHAQAAEIEEAAHARVRAKLQDAEEAAAQIRAEALTKVAGASQQLDDLLRVRESIVSTMRAAAREFESLIGKVERGDRAAFIESAPAAPAAEPAAYAAAAVPETFAAPAVEPAQALPAYMGSGSDQVFDGRVELDAGPFGDFAALSAFERAVARVPHVSDVYVRRFAEDRAAIEVTLSGPTPLVGGLSAVLPYPVDVRSVSDERISLDVQAVASVR